MANRGCCRNCGRELMPMSICLTCREHVSWLCNGCGRADDSIHAHPGFKYPKLDLFR